jgi:peptide deformylase
MAILKVSRMGHPVLRQCAQTVPPDQIQSPPLQRLIEDMVDTMIDYEGIGLAAPQVFESLRVIVLGMPEADPEDEETIPLTVLFNPEFTVMSDERVDGWEGCLSIPQLRGVVSRAAAVEVKGLDGEGVEVEFAAEEIFARVLQHEVDHLDGVLFLDRMEDLQTLTFFEEYQRFWLEPEE